MSPILLSLTVGLAATAISLPPGVLVAWILERTRFPGKWLLHGLVLLPLVLPPVVTGYLLLKFFSPRNSGIGRMLEDWGMPVAFEWLGAVVAAAVVGFPLLVLSVSLAMKAIDSRMEVVARSLGRSRWATFWRVTLPLAWPGILAGSVLSFARGLGEFGATIILAGRQPEKTETIPLAIYSAMEAPGQEERVQALIIASLIICLAAVAATRVLDSWHRRRLELSR
ncbi:MAG TPA: molybdate ABC transporter permease subunit [Candidatus Eisenbacteria bacterium]|nr:molybdate ABC transporter permease subunit [Candidatus Eisenbacteria bacterium]